MNETKILDLDSNSSLVFIFSENKWFVKNKSLQEYHDFSKEESLKALLKVLYIKPEEFFAKLEMISKSKNQFESLRDSFPLNNLILFCIKNKMVFWLELAVVWLKYAPKNADLVEAILGFNKDSNVDQRLRHNLKRALGR